MRYMPSVACMGKIRNAYVEFDLLQPPIVLSVGEQLPQFVLGGDCQLSFHQWKFFTGFDPRVLCYLCYHCSLPKVALSPHIQSVHTMSEKAFPQHRHKSFNQL